MFCRLIELTKQDYLVFNQVMFQQYEIYGTSHTTVIRASDIIGIHYCHWFHHIYIDHVCLAPLIIFFPNFGNEYCPPVPYGKLFTRCDIKLPKSDSETTKALLLWHFLAPETYNPGSSAQIYCSSCGIWFDFANPILRTILSQSQKNFPLADRCRWLPVLRGAGWLKFFPEKWAQLKIQHQPAADVILWVIAGSMLLKKRGMFTSWCKPAAEFIDVINHTYMITCVHCNKAM